MIERNVLLGVLYLAGSLLFYILHRIWIKGKDNESNYVKPLTNYTAIKHRILVVLLFILSLYYFMK